MFAGEIRICPYLRVEAMKPPVSTQVYTDTRLSKDTLQSLTRRVPTKDKMAAPKVSFIPEEVHEFLTQRAAESAFRDRCRTSSAFILSRTDSILCVISEPLPIRSTGNWFSHSLGSILPLCPLPSVTSHMYYVVSWRYHT